MNYNTLHSSYNREMLSSQIRRQISTTAIRSANMCLLNRVNQCGDSAALAAKRREVNLREEEHMRREREIQWICRTRGGPIVRKGQFFRC